MCYHHLGVKFLPSQVLLCLSPNNTKMKMAQAPTRNGLTTSTLRRRRRVTTAVIRLEQGNFSNVKPVGSGVSEYRVDFGPGYRIYFARDGDQIIILLGGGTKKRQQPDINLAIERWQDYKRRKKLGDK